MKVFTLFELQQFEAYPTLKLILNDAEIQIFFNTPEAQRGAKIPNKVVRRVAEPKATPIFTVAPTPKPIRVFKPTPQRAPQILGTQKCTSVSIENIRAMAMDYMGRDFDYRGITYNLNKLGWRFRFSDKKRSLGTCISNWSRTGTIELSQWIITNSEEKYDKWVNTMLHEIAHAIHVTIRGKSDHSWEWKSIARTIGCDAERTTKVEWADLIANPISKYTMVCAKGHTSPRHKRQSAHSSQSCSQCNKEIGMTGFNRDFIMEQIINW